MVFRYLKTHKDSREVLNTIVVGSLLVAITGFSFFSYMDSPTKISEIIPQDTSVSANHLLQIVNRDSIFVDYDGSKYIIVETTRGSGLVKTENIYMFVPRNQKENLNSNIKFDPYYVSFDKFLEFVGEADTSELVNVIEDSSGKTEL